MYMWLGCRFLLDRDSLTVPTLVASFKLISDSSDKKRKQVCKYNMTN